MSELSLLTGGGEALRSDSDSDGAVGTIINRNKYQSSLFIVPLRIFLLTHHKVRLNVTQNINVVSIFLKKRPPITACLSM